jgi:hypothetical protein
VSHPGAPWQHRVVRAPLASVVLVGLVLVAGSLRAEQATGDLIVEARLVDVVEAPLCGIMHTAAAARYEVIRAVQGSYDGRELYAIHDCSPLRRQNIGEVHRLTLSRRIPQAAGSVFDTFADRSSPRLWVVRFDVVAQ